MMSSTTPSTARRSSEPACMRFARDSGAIARFGSMTTQSIPARRNVSASVNPVGPAPTIATSVVMSGFPTPTPYALRLLLHAVTFVTACNMSTMVSSADRDHRTAVLDATRSLIEDRGPESWTMEDVTERSGVTRMTVYRYFESRARLLIETTRHVDELEGATARFSSLMSCRTGPEALDRWVEIWTGYVQKIHGLASALFSARWTDEAAAAALDERMTFMRGGCGSRRGLARSGGCSGARCRHRDGHGFDVGACLAAGMGPAGGGSSVVAGSVSRRDHSSHEAGAVEGVSRPPRVHGRSPRAEAEQVPECGAPLPAPWCLGVHSGAVAPPEGSVALPVWCAAVVVVVGCGSVRRRVGR